MNKERILELLVLIKVELGTSEHLYTLMEELGIDWITVDRLRDEHIKEAIESFKLIGLEPPKSLLQQL
tara:strand:+ start:791 stop:994 length:204 start_codon:yes stop_codon:yes gene_type:complete